MKAKIGMIVDTDFGRGPIIAMTKTWCIQQTEDGEVAVAWEDDFVSIPVQAPDGVEGGLTEMEVE